MTQRKLTEAHWITTAAISLMLFIARPVLGSNGDVLFQLNAETSKSLAANPSENWSFKDNALVFELDNWPWGKAVIDVGTNDYELDAVVNIDPLPGKNNAAGFVFRQEQDKAAAFYIWQPLGGYSAFGEILGPAGVWSKASCFALSKDQERGDHHLRAIVKSNTANCYVDGRLAVVLDLRERPSGKVGLYAHHTSRFKSLTIRRLGPDVRLATTRPARDILEDGKGFKPAKSWRSIVGKAGAIVDGAIREGTEGVPGEESMPAYTYRCVTYMKPGVRPFYAYPAFHHALIIHGLMGYSDLIGDKKYADAAITLARWELSHSTPRDAKLPHLPYSTTMNGTMGGNVDGTTVMLDKAGAMGNEYLSLYERTKLDEFKQGAIRIAETLLRVQQPEGRWQNRVEFVTGKVVQDYTSSQIFNVRLMDRLYRLTGDERYTASAKRAFQWVLDNPVRTGKWTGYYEDVDANTQSIGNWDAIETARYLLEHRKDNPQYVEIARELVEWITTSFVVRQGGRWPVVCEQTHCMPVMSGHTLHYAQLLADVYEATGEQIYRDAAVSSAYAGFDLARQPEEWYSLLLSPLELGIEVAQRLRLAE